MWSVGAVLELLRMGFGAMPMVPMPMGAMPGAMLGNAMMEEDAKAKEAKEAQEAKEKEAKEEEALPLQEKPLTSEIILEAELYLAKRELEQQREAAQYQRTHYSASTLTTYVLRMETGLPTKEVFQIVVNYASRFKDSSSYYTG